MGLFTKAPSEKSAFKKLKEEGCVVTFSLEVPSAEVEKEMHTHLLRIQQRARLPGFRPGKAPMALIQKEFTGNARQEAFDHLIRKYIPAAMSELKIEPVASPTIQDVAFKPGTPLEVKVEAEIAPKVTVKDYLKIAVKKKNYPALDEDLNKRLEELREGNARLDKTPSEAVLNTHYVVIDYAATRDGKAITGAKGESELVDMASEQTIEGLVDGLLGMQREESKDIQVKIDQKPAVMKVTIREIKEKILPALDGEFAKDMGFATIDELKAKLKEVLEKEGQVKSEREVQQQLEEALLKGNKIPLPPSLVEAQLEHSMERLRKRLLGPNGRFPENQLEDLRGKVRPQAENELRISYLLSSIAEKEKIQTTDEDLKAELERNLAEAETDKQREELRGMFAERKETIANLIRDRKTMTLIKDKAVITEG